MIKKSLLLPVVAFCVIWLSAATARADSVVLTSGFVSSTNSEARVNLLSTSFSLHYLGEIPSGTPRTIAVNSVTLAQGFPSLTFNGTTSNFFSGLLTFNDTLLTGHVTAYQTFDDMYFGRSPLFNVEFDAAGYVTLSQVEGGGMTTSFNVVSTPEPTTMILFGTGLSAVVAGRRRRKVRKL